MSKARIHFARFALETQLEPFYVLPLPCGAAPCHAHFARLAVSSSGHTVGINKTTNRHGEHRYEPCFSDVHPSVPH